MATRLEFSCSHAEVGALVVGTDLTCICNVCAATVQVRVLQSRSGCYSPGQGATGQRSRSPEFSYLPGQAEAADRRCVQPHDDGKQTVEVPLGLTAGQSRTHCY